MKKRITIKAVLSLLMAAILFCMPVGAFVKGAGRLGWIKRGNLYE